MTHPCQPPCSTTLISSQRRIDFVVTTHAGGSRQALPMPLHTFVGARIGSAAAGTTRPVCGSATHARQPPRRALAVGSRARLPMPDAALPAARAALPRPRHQAVATDGSATDFHRPHARGAGGASCRDGPLDSPAVAADGRCADRSGAEPDDESEGSAGGVGEAFARDLSVGRPVSPPAGAERRSGVPACGSAGGSSAALGCEGAGAFRDR
jgi:hypothetical protein